MAQQTAVQWLSQQLELHQKTEKLILYAQEIFKEQIKTAYYTGYIDRCNSKEMKPDEHYKETYIL